MKIKEFLINKKAVYVPQYFAGTIGMPGQWSPVDGGSTFGKERNQFEAGKAIASDKLAEWIKDQGEKGLTLPRFFIFFANGRQCQIATSKLIED